MNNKYEEVIKRLDNMQKDIDAIMEHLNIEKEQEFKKLAEDALKKFKDYFEHMGVTVHIEEID